jgi:hypothetical protein
MHFLKATQRVWHDPQRPSYLELTVVPEGKRSAL